jgi:hypothetical protein
MPSAKGYEPGYNRAIEKKWLQRQVEALGYDITIVELTA